MDGAAAAVPVSIRLRRSNLAHDAYTVRVFDRRFAALATARPSDARRWVATTRWLHGALFHRGRLVVGLGVQWTPTGRPLHGALPVPATLQLCVGHRCLVFHLAHAGGAVPEALRRFLADPRVTFVGSGAANDRRMLSAHHGLRVARALELRAFAAMGNASLGDMADRYLGYPGICKPRDVAMSAWHAPRLSPDQVLYAAVDAYLAFRLGVVLCPAAEQPSQHVLPRAPPPVPVRQAPPAQQRAPPVARQMPPAQQRAPAVARLAPPVQQRAPAVARQAPPVQQRAPAVVHPAPRFEWSPRAFAGGSVPAVVGVDTAITGSKVRCGVIALGVDSSETDYDDDVSVGGGLPVRLYASDSDDIADSSDGFEHVKLGVFADDAEDEDDGYVSYSGTGSLGADGVDSNGDDQEGEEGYDEDDQEDEEGCDGDDQEDEEGCDGDDLEDEEGCGGDDLEDEEGYNEYTGTGILTDDNNMDGYGEYIRNMVAAAIKEEMGGDYQTSEYLVHSEMMLDNGEDALGQDDWHDQEVDYGCDEDDEYEFEEFCLL